MKKVDITIEDVNRYSKELKKLKIGDVMTQEMFNKLQIVAAFTLNKYNKQNNNVN